MVFCPNCGARVDQLAAGGDEPVTTDIQTEQIDEDDDDVKTRFYTDVDVPTEHTEPEETPEAAPAPEETVAAPSAQYEGGQEQADQAGAADAYSAPAPETGAPAAENADNGAAAGQTVFCPNCGHRCSAAEVFCEECGARLDGSDAGAAGAQGADAGVSGTGKKKSHKWLIAVPVVAVLAAAAFFGMKYIKKPGGGKTAKVTKVLYYTDDTLKLADLNKSKNMSKEVTDQLFDRGGSADQGLSGFKLSGALTADEKYAYYPNKVDQNGEFDLMKIRVSDIGKKENKSEKIASGVYDYAVLKTGKVVYCKSSNLYLTDGKKDGETKIASNLPGGNQGGFWFSKDETELLWIETKNDKSSVYLMNITSAKNKKTEIVKGMPADAGKILDYSDDLKKIYILDDGELDLYDEKGKKTKIDRDVVAATFNFDKSPFYEKEGKDKYTHSLYYYDGGKENMLTETERNLNGGDGMFGSCSEDCCMFFESTAQTGTFSSAAASQTKPTLKIFHGKDEIYSEDDFENGAGGLTKATQSGKVYFSVKVKNNSGVESDLKSISLKGSNSSAKDVAEDVGHCLMIGDDLFYTADLDSNGNGTLYKNEKEIADDVCYIYSISGDDLTPLVQQDYDKGSFTLGKLNGSKVTEIGEDISSYSAINGNSILVLYDRSKSSGDYSFGYYNGKKLIPIDDGVRGVFSSRK